MPIPTEPVAEISLGDYAKAVERKVYSENISKVLYPNDNTFAGRQLRLKQQYFFVACSILLALVLTRGWRATRGVVVAFVLAQLTNVGEYISLTGMVDRPVPFGPTIMFRYALSFISLAVPSDAGAIAIAVAEFALQR